MRQRLTVDWTSSAFVINSSNDPGQGLTPTDYAEISNVLSPPATPYSPPYTHTCNRLLSDVTEPPRRFGMNPSSASTANYAGQFATGGNYTTLAYETNQDQTAKAHNGAANYQRFAGADLMLSNVLSFEVRVLPKGWNDFADVYDLAKVYGTPPSGTANPAFNVTNGPMAFDTWSSVHDTALNFDYSNFNWLNGSAANNNNDRIPMWDWGNLQGQPAATGVMLQAIQITIRVWDEKTELTRQVTIVVPL
jgi:hypothetical protein